MAVDEAQTGLDGIDTETRVRNVEERHRREEFDVDRRVIENKADRALEHQRRPGNGVDDMTVVVRLGDETRSDRLVDVVEGVRALVQIVETRGITGNHGGRVL